MSLRGVTLARTVALSIGAWVQRNGITEADIAAHPELLESLLSEQAGILLTALENNECSGAFIILDASMDNKNSAPKAGLYFKRTETNNVTSIASRTYCLRGPASIARANGIELLGQWRAGMDVNSAEFFDRTLNAARQSGEKDLSRLYYWSRRCQMEGDSEQYMLLCVPLIAADNTVYGVCGWEMSAMMFKNLYAPDSVQYPRVFAALAPFFEDGIDTGAGLVAGSSFMSSRMNGQFLAFDSRQDMTLWSAPDGTQYIGRAESLALFPSGSPFANETWALAVLMPMEDWDAVVGQSNAVFYGAFAGLLFISLFAAVFISRRYIRPVALTLQGIKSDDRTGLPKTQIVEIDDLLEYLAMQDEERKTLNEEREILAAELEQAKSIVQTRNNSIDAPVLASFKQFLENRQTLTETERDVFNNYMEGLTAREIAEKMFVTHRTIKFHNKNIYAKLGVSSLKEMQIYITMMKEMGEPR